MHFCDKLHSLSEFVLKYNKNRKQKKFSGNFLMKRNSYRINIFLAAVLLISAVAFFAPRVQAVTTDTIGVLPAYPDPNVQYSDSWLIYKLNLGEVKEDGVQIINNKDETVVVKVYAVDATTTSDGAFALLPEDAAVTDVGGWVRLAAGEIEIPAKSKKLVPFQISIPKNADVGDHMGGIVIQEVQADDQLQGTGVKIITRVGVRIYETVPGEVSKTYELTRFDWRMAPSGQKNFVKDLLDLNKKTAFYIGIKNEGNVKLTPLATITLKNMFGGLWLISKTEKSAWYFLTRKTVRVWSSGIRFLFWDVTRRPSPPASLKRALRPRLSRL